VTIEGVEYEVGKGSVVYIPGDAEHGMRCVGDEEVTWLYVFAVGGFAEVEYRFRGGRSCDDYGDFGGKKT
jgi:quercetin dioxygenase-like cupin family protein